MPLLMQQRRLAAWLGVVALVAAALLPGVEQLLRRSGGEGWVEVCSTTGSRWLRVAPDAGGGANDAPAHGDSGRHCVACLVVAAAVLPPAAAPQPAPAWRLARVAAPDRLAPDIAAAPPRSRGPPTAPPPSPLRTA